MNGVELQKTKRCLCLDAEFTVNTKLSPWLLLYLLILSEHVPEPAFNRAANSSTKPCPGASKAAPLKPRGLPRPGPEAEGSSSSRPASAGRPCGPPTHATTPQLPRFRPLARDDKPRAVISASLHARPGRVSASVCDTGGRRISR